MKVNKTSEILFLIVGVLAALEFIFIRGSFTWLIAVAAVIAIGAWNILLKAKSKDWLSACLYLLASTALCMGYFALI